MDLQLDFTDNPLVDALQDVIRLRWPPMLVRRSRREAIGYQIVVRPFYIIGTEAPNYYPALPEVPDPRSIFEQAANILIDVVERPRNRHMTIIVQKELNEALSRATFGSLAMEGAGLDRDTTLKFCRYIFQGGEVEYIDEDTPGYKEKLDEFMGCPGTEDTDYTKIIRGREEIFWHASAIQYLMDEVITRNHRFSEDIIKVAHTILCGHGLPEDDTVPGRTIPDAGEYRTGPVEAGNGAEVPPGRVGSYMAGMVGGLNAMLYQDSAIREVDPFELAARCAMRFTSAHPFRYGNGQMCTIFLNVILCRCTGVIVPMGEDEADREVYRDLITQTLTDGDECGQFATYVLVKARTRLRVMKKKLAGKRK